MSKFLKIFAPSLGGAALTLTTAYMLADQFVVDVPSVAPQIIGSAHAEEPSPVAAPKTDPVPVPVVKASVPLGLGRAALPEEIAAWDGDISPDGTGLPVGSGDAIDGEEIFAEHCAACHGDFAEGIDNWPKLAGGADTLDHEDPLKTVGSYWPYLSTTYDYIKRSMPYGNAGTLSDDDVYAIVAYILYSNDLIEDDFVLSNETFLDVEMPNAGGFIIDDRAEAEYAQWTGEPCMENCKAEDVKVTMRAMVLDVTPEEEGAEATVTEVAETEAAESEEVVEEVAETEVEIVAVDPELTKAGEKAFQKCKACHQVGEGAKNRSGPILNGVVGRAAGSVDGFKYSKDFSNSLFDINEIPIIK